MTERVRRAAILAFPCILLSTACDASTPPAAPSATTRAPAAAAATYSPTEFTGNRACAGLLLGNVQLQILPDGTTLGLAFRQETPALRSVPMTIVWPPGYTLRETADGREIVNRDGTKVYRDGEDVQDLGACPYPDRRTLVWDPPR